MPLVKRALKVLADREVSPQLGLLKSTLLQLDSSFSERDYGVSSFRDFADKLAQQGLVALKHQGRSTMVELSDPSTPQSPRSEQRSLRASSVAAAGRTMRFERARSGRRAARELFENGGRGHSQRP